MSQSDAPVRAHSLILNAGGDSAQELARELESLAFRLRTEGVTVGWGGGPSASSIYSYRVEPGQTHERYFQEVDAWLAARPARA